jgi:hypothetical protein
MADCYGIIVEKVEKWVKLDTIDDLGDYDHDDIREVASPSEDAPRQMSRWRPSPYFVPWLDRPSQLGVGH